MQKNCHSFCGALFVGLCLTEHAEHAKIRRRPLYRFELVNLCFREQVIPNWGRIFRYRPDYPGVEMKQLVLDTPVLLGRRILLV